MNKNKMLCPTSTVIWYETSNKLAPSIIIERAAAVICVSGNISAKFCISGFAPSRENHTPDKNIMGQVIRFNNPPAVSSLVVRADTIKLRLIRLIAPSANTNNRLRC